MVCDTTVLFAKTKNHIQCKTGHKLPTDKPFLCYCHFVSTYQMVAYIKNVTIYYT